MKILGRFTRLAAASVLSLTSLLVLAVPMASAAGPFICTWTGGGSDSKFSTAGNWSGCNSAAPQPADNDDLIFPEAATNKAPVNDLVSGVFGTVSFTGGTSSTTGYTITGTDATIANITDSSTTTLGNELNISITTIGATGAYVGNDNSQLILGDLGSIGTKSVNVAAATTLTLTDADIFSAVTTVSGTPGITVNSPSGDLGVSLNAADTFSGTVHVTGGELLIGAHNDSASFTADSGTVISGTGTAKSLVISTGANLDPDEDVCLTTGSGGLTLNGTFNEFLDGTGVTPCTDFSQLSVTGGTPTLTGSTLSVTLGSTDPAVGATFLILKNTSGNPVTGTFTGLAEGGTFTVGDVTFSITYLGNSENDVVLTVTKVGATAAATPAAATPKTPDTGLALVAAHPAVSLLVSTISAATLVYVARRLKPVLK